ncbi:MAG: L-dopachrome tautomerase-related protein [Cyanobacteria bacterium P01_A01_bin.135]
MLKRFSAIAATSILLTATLPTLVGLARADGHAPLRDTSTLETVSALPREHPPGNIAVTPDGRLIMSQHQFYGTDYKMVEVLADGQVVPFPNEAWSSAPDASGIGLNNVLGVRSDRQGVVWMLDNPGDSGTGRLVGWDTGRDQLHQVIYLPPSLIPENAFLNDFAIDDFRNAAYIADTAGGDNGALVVVDLTTGYARRVLEGHASMRPEEIDMVIDGEVVRMGEEPARIGVNPITIDPDNQWVYYGPMTGRSLYRVRAADLMDTELDSVALAGRVERFGDKAISDGITIDAGGNIYVTDITNSAIGIVQPDGTYRMLYQDPQLSWTDGFGFGPDNYIYVTVNQLQRSPALNGGEDASVPPFYLLRFPAVEAGVVGR